MIKVKVFEEAKNEKEQLVYLKLISLKTNNDIILAEVDEYGNQITCGTILFISSLSLGIRRATGYKGKLSIDKDGKVEVQ